MLVIRGTETFAHCQISVRALQYNLVRAVDLYARTPRVNLHGGGPRAVARHRLSDGVVSDLEAYSLQLATLAAALESITDDMP